MDEELERLLVAIIDVMLWLLFTVGIFRKAIYDIAPPTKPCLQ